CKLQGTGGDDFYPPGILHAPSPLRLGDFSDRAARSPHRGLSLSSLQAGLLDLYSTTSQLRGNREVLRDFTEAGLLVALLTRLIANLDRVASVEASPGTPVSEKGN